MRAMVLERPGPAASRPLVARQLDDPRPGPGQVVLRVLSCGVCRTDLHTVEGDLALPRLPLVPGHQIVGVVEEAAPELGPDMVGRRVGVAWLADACGGCEWCRSGRENLCPSARFTGLDRDGGYAERVAVDAAFTYPIPDGFDDDAGRAAALRRRDRLPRAAPRGGARGRHARHLRLRRLGARGDPGRPPRRLPGLRLHPRGPPPRSRPRARRRLGRLARRNASGAPSTTR